MKPKNKVKTFKINHYLNLCDWLRLRYQKYTGVIVTHYAGKPTRYTVLCRMAFDKYILRGK